MSTGYKIYYFIKDTLCYLVFGIVLLPLRFLLSGGFMMVLGSMRFFAAWLQGNAKLSEGPPIGTFFMHFLKWALVFAISAALWLTLLHPQWIQQLTTSPTADAPAEIN